MDDWSVQEGDKKANAALQRRAAEVIKPLIPPDAQERVRRAFKQWNQIVRDHIRNETALKLSDGDGRHSVPVKIVDGFPESLAELIDKNRDPVLWRLIIGQPKLGGIIEGLNFLLEVWDAFEDWPHLPDLARGGEPTLRHTREIADALQQLAMAEQVRKQIKEISEDILGAYFYPFGRGSWVELYWMAIAMVAAMQEVRIEDLTLVVLAHELTHAYTHVGRDIDGIQWDAAAFHESDPNIKEGLAQFYTEVVTDKLAARHPGPKAAYEALLSLQRGPYLAHREWMKDDDKQRGETIRFTMVAARSQPPLKYDEWQALMAMTNKNLKPRHGGEASRL